MPKGNIDYSKSYIYKLCCKDVNIKEIYVGSTTNMYVRKKSHKNDCNSDKSKRHNLYLYKFIRDYGGFDNWDMILIEEYNCDELKQLLKRERYWIDKLQSKLNTIKRPYVDEYEKKQTIKEYREKNKERIKEYRINNKERIKEYEREYREKNKECIKEYRDNHKEEHNEYTKKHYQENKEKYLNNSKKKYVLNKEHKLHYQKQYNKKNKHKLATYNKEYREINKYKLAIKRKEYLDKNKHKVLCDCGAEISKINLSTHRKTQKHLNLIKSNLHQD